MRQLDARLDPIGDFVDWKLSDIPDQTGRQVIVTGANSGLGFEVTKRLARAGASVTMACRNVAKAEAAAGQIRELVPGAKVEVAVLDLADLHSVASFAKEYAAKHDRLDVLVNNAGLMAVDRGRTADGFEMHIGVNHLGHYALTQHLLPLLIATPGSRIATMTSMGHRLGLMRFGDLMSQRPYFRWTAYTQSKLANLLFTVGLQQRLAATGAATIAVTAHPGASNTDLGYEGHSITNRLSEFVMSHFAQPAAVGSLPMLRAVTDPAVRGGEYYGCQYVVSGKPVRVKPALRARSTKAAEKLWNISAELTGLDAFKEHSKS